MLTGCAKETVNKQHEQYLQNQGWEILKSIEVRNYTLNIPEEMLSNYEASGVTFIKEYLGQEVTVYAYALKEKDIDGAHLKAVVFESEDEIIGGYGALPSWTPGMFSLDDKERLIDEGMIKQ